MYRKPALSKLLIAGWHGHAGMLTAVYQASNISWETAIREFRLGKENKAAGKPCNCPKCCPNKDVVGGSKIKVLLV